MMSFLTNLQCCFSRSKDVKMEEEDDFEEDEIFAEKLKIRKDEIEKKLTKKSAYDDDDKPRDKTKDSNNDLPTTEIEKLKMKLSQDPYLSERYNTILIDSKYIREEEKDVITFSRLGVLELIERLEAYKDWKELYNQKNLKIEIRDNTFINDKLHIGKHTFTIPKSSFKQEVTLPFLRKIIFNSEIRKKWDTSIKDLEIIEGVGDTVYISNNVMKSPIFFISERDTLDKRIEFIHNNIFYNITTAIDDQFKPPLTGVVRCKNYLNLNMYEITETDVVFTGYSQVDFRMNLPQSFVTFTLPYKLSSWYDDMVKNANELDDR